MIKLPDLVEVVLFVLSMEFPDLRQDIRSITIRRRVILMRSKLVYLMENIMLHCFENRQGVLVYFPTGDNGTVLSLVA